MASACGKLARRIVKSQLTSMRSGSRVISLSATAPGVFAERQLMLDSIRVAKAEKKMKQEEKQRRKQRRRCRKGIEEQIVEAEGVTYEAGGF